MKHNNCYYCGQNGFIFRSYRFEDLAIVADIKIEKRHEGWPGIPHGGLAMTTFIELIDIAKEFPAVFPYEYRFRFAGERLMCGDIVRCIVQKGDARYYFGSFGKSLQQPYCNCRYSEGHVHAYSSEIIEILKNNLDASTPFVIPNMSTKLINTDAYEHNQRTFYIKDYRTDKTYMNLHLNGDNKFARASNGSVHNGVISSLLDETMGWSTFLSVWQTGVTVELQITFYDMVYNSEDFYVIGFCDEVRGGYGKKITTAYGGVLAQRGDELAIIALSYGRWLTMPGYKELMIQYLKHYIE